MTRALALSLLRSGANGDQILQIVETIATPEDGTVTVAERTSETIEF